MTDSRRYPARPVVGVGAAVFDGESVVLIKRRFEPLAGRWSLPGGGLEVGETLEVGAAREVREETGLEVDVGPVVEVFDRIVHDDDGGVEYHFVLVRLPLPRDRRPSGARVGRVGRGHGRPRCARAVRVDKEGGGGHRAARVR